MFTCLADEVASGSKTAPLSSRGEDVDYLEREFAAARKSPAVQQIVDSGAMYDGLWYWDLENQSNVYISAMFWRALGQDPAQCAHKLDVWLSHVFEEDRESVVANLKAHVADPEVPFDRTVRMHRPNGNSALVRSRGVAIRENGRPVRMIGSHVILSDTRPNEVTERLSEIMALSKDAIIVWSQACGVKRWNRGAERLFGVVKPAILHHSHIDRLAPVFQEDWDTIEHQISSGGTWIGQVEWTCEDGRKVVTETQLQRLAVNGGVTLILEVDRDITAEVALAQHHRTVMRELNHRVKNLFAVIRALIKMTARGQTEVPTLVHNLDQRISALAAAHVVSLGHDTKNGAPLDELLRAVLTAYPADPASLRIEGCPLWLPQDHITPMGLILNELATNALKYGAWSTPEGLVTISWSLSGKDGARLLILDWREHSPGFEPPDTEKRGFGSQLLDLSVRQMAASVSRRFGPEGLQLSLVVELGSIECTAPRQN